ISNNNYDNDDDDDDEYEDDEDDDEYSYNPGHCRREALRCQKLRNKAFRNASEAYRGQEYDQEMKTWNLRYVMSSTEQQRNGKNIIDLHGLTVDQAVYVVRKHLNRLYPKGDIYSGKPLKIITGVGNHSPNGIPKLPNAVRQVLKNNWDFVENRGHMIVKGQIFNI
ncbi:17843_t:CDS:2, partial [Entrophospora sp. SA101]